MTRAGGGTGLPPWGTRLGELPALLEALPRLGAKEAEALAADVDEARSRLGPPEDPWAS